MIAPLLPFSVWVPILDGDPEAARIYNRHYASERSRKRRLARRAQLILGPGEKLLLSTPCRRALFGWRRFIDDSGQIGVNCAVFANLGAGLSSELIRLADEVADQRWPNDRHYTYVDPRRGSRNPGYCFKKAGWRYCGKTKCRGLHILERAPGGVA